LLNEHAYTISATRQKNDVFSSSMEGKRGREHTNTLSAHCLTRILT
jgi:hypothetical protein